MIRTICAVLLLAVPLPVLAQSASVPAQAPAPLARPDAARLAAARMLIDELMPPATREQMIDGMIRPMLANIQRGMAEQPAFAAAMSADPRAKAIFDRFMARQFDRTTERMRAGLPGMVDAMTAAYARRFDPAQLAEILAFFRTPTGRTYMRESMTIMADPDVAAWQRTTMADSMGHIQDDIAQVAREIAALPQEATP